MQPASIMQSQVSAPDRQTPLVSVGLPVFNGERYLARAIETILGQTLADLELIICDNASTDRTPEICQTYAGRDRRVRYFRNPHNLGAGPNYDRCFAESRGRYFKWAAHDDMLAADCLAKTVAVLERNPDAVLCCTGIAEIGPEDEIIRTYANELPNVDSPDPAKRLAGMIMSKHECENFFGVFRREALVGSQLHGAFSGSDRVLLAETALRGRCLKVPDALFFHREHDERYTRAVLAADRRRAAVWQDSRSTARNTQFHLVVYRNYWRAVRRTVSDPAVRRACHRQLIRWWFVDYHFADVVKDVLGGVHPMCVTLARRAKRALFGQSSVPPTRLSNS